LKFPFAVGLWKAAHGHLAVVCYGVSAGEQIEGAVRISANGMENSWSLLKRGLHGTYVLVEPFHLFRYLDEQAFRLNKRHRTDADRFVQLCANVTGKRSDWKTLTGKKLGGPLRLWTWKTARHWISSPGFHWRHMRVIKVMYWDAKASS